MILISSCNKKTSKAQLISSKVLNDFPSASAIEYDNGRLYLFGDDASYLLMLDTNYNVTGKIQYLSDTSFRIKKSEKADIESAAFINSNYGKELMGLGSLSSETRMKLFRFSSAGDSTHAATDLTSIIGKLKAIPELNIEGMAMVGPNIILANRANKKHRVNKLIVGNNDLQSFSLSVITDMQFNNKNVIGVSGLYYLKEKDVLLFTASEEDTYSATQDGAISDSYLGWINEFSKKMKARVMKPNEMIKLSSVDKTFTKQKIESVCVQQISGNEVLLHLVSDNDDGKSGLFKLRLRL